MATIISEISMKYPTRYAIWDLETTGFSPTENHIVEIAAMVIEDGKVVDEYSVLLNNDVDIPAEAEAIHHISKEMCAADGIDPKEAIIHLSKMIVAAGACVTHNGTRFDAAFLAAHSTRLGCVNEATMEILAYRHFDTAALYKGSRMAQEWNPESEMFRDYAIRILNERVPGLKYNVGVCCDTLGIDRSATVQHRAMGDVELTYEIFKKLTYGEAESSVRPEQTSFLAEEGSAPVPALSQVVDSKGWR